MQLIREIEAVYREEGFTAGIKLEEADIKKFIELLEAKKEREVWREITDFATKEGHGMPFIDDEDGDKSILLEIRDRQLIFFADIPGIKSGLWCVLLGKPF